MQLAIRGADFGPTAVGQSIYEHSATPTTSLGAKLRLRDREFRYCKNGAADLVPGVLVQGPALTADDEDLAPDATAAGSFTVIVTRAGATADQYAGGYMTVNVAGTGGTAGTTYRIKSNTAASSNKITLTLYDPLLDLLATADTKVTLHENPYNGVVIAPYAAFTGPAVGVTNCAVTAAYYFWAQTRGVCGVLNDGGTGVVGVTCVRSTSVDGAVSVQLTDAAQAGAMQPEQRVGTFLQTLTAGRTGFVLLQLP